MVLGSRGLNITAIVLLLGVGIGVAVFGLITNVELNALGDWMNSPDRNYATANTSANKLTSHDPTLRGLNKSSETSLSPPQEQAHVLSEHNRYGWQDHQATIGCSEAKRITDSLKTSMLRAKGSTRTVDLVKMNGENVVVKRPMPGRSKNYDKMMKEVRVINAYPGPGFPTMYGYCLNGRASWIVFEEAVPFRLPLAKRPSCGQLFSFIKAPISHFLNYPNLSLDSDINPKQFAVAGDRVVLADFDNIHLQGAPNVKASNATSCVKASDCAKTGRPFKERFSVNCRYRCLQNKCQKSNNSQHNACVIREVILGQLSSHYRQLLPVFKKIQDSPQSRRTDLQTFYDVVVSEQPKVCS